MKTGMANRSINTTRNTSTTPSCLLARFACALDSKPQGAVKADFAVWLFCLSSVLSSIGSFPTTAEEPTEHQPSVARVLGETVFVPPEVVDGLQSSCRHVVGATLVAGQPEKRCAFHSSCPRPALPPTLVSERTGAPMSIPKIVWTMSFGFSVI